MTPFAAPADEGQPGWVLLPDGRRAYRYAEADELIIPEAGQPASQEPVGGGSS